MAGFASPNYTQTPNIFFDEMLSQMKEAELKVALVIMRETFGWHRESKQMSLSYLMQATGMSKQGVLNGITDGIARGVICQEPSGNSYKYSLVVNEVDENERSSQRSRPRVVNEVDTLLVNEVDTTNKETNKEERNSTPPAALGKRKRQPTPEHMRIAELHGMDKRDMTALVDAVLDATGKTEMASIDTDMAGRELSYAQECAVNLVQQGISDPLQVADGLAMFRSDWREDSVPSYRQLVDACIRAKKQGYKHRGRGVMPAGGTRNADGSISIAFTPPVPAYAAA